MEQARTNRHLVAGLAFGLAVILGLTTAAPAGAQQPSSRFRVMIPLLERQNDADDDFGEDLVEELRDRIDDMATHAPVDEDEFEDALDQFDLDKDKLTCIQNRQLAVQLRAQLVMCGSYRETGEDQFEVAVQFISTESGSSFDIPAFTSSEPEEAATQIFSAFEEFNQQIRMTAFCVEYVGSQQWENALRNCDQALEMNPNETRALYAKARALMELDSLEAALDNLQRVLEINEVHQDALKTAGIVAIRLDRKDLAREYFHEYLELNPGDVDVRLTVALDMHKAGDPTGALAILEEGLQDTTNLTLVEYAGHFALGAAQEAEEAQGAADAEEMPAEAKQLYEKALGYYQQVFDAKGEEAEATMLKNMVAALTKLERLDEAAQLGAEIVAAKPEDPALWSTYAQTLNEAGRYDEALAALDSVETRDPDYPRLNARRGILLLRSDRLDEAAAAFKVAVEKGEAESDALARTIFGHGYNTKYKTDRLDEAMEVFAVAREFATTPATEAMTNFWTGYILFKQGQAVQKPSTAESAKKALPIFERALEYFKVSGPYAETQGSINLQQFIDNTNQFIEIQKALIKRG